ncbi:MAG: restriction endonuclease [Reyranella sp.]
MAVPDFQSLMLPVLRGVADGPIAAPELRQRVADSVHMTEADLAELLPSGRQTTFSNRVAWANIFLQRASLIRTVRRGVYEITQAGKEVLERAPPRIDMKFLEQFPSYTRWREESGTRNGGADTPPPASPPTTPTNPEEQIERSHRELVAAVEADLLQRLRTLTPAQFERVIVDLLVAMGYGGGRSEMARALGRSGDNGVDGVVHEDKLGLDVVYMQAKKYAAERLVDAPAVRDFVGSLDYHRATKGVFVTTSRFTDPSKEYVGRVSKRVVLIEGSQLASLMVAHGVGVRVKERYEVVEIDEDAFTE